MTANQYDGSNVKAVRKKELQTVDAMEERNGIPEFDLAEQIMAEQRKNVSVRRKKPAAGARPVRQKTEDELVGRTIGLQPVSVGQDQVVADIVAKDIERLCRSSV